MRFPHLLGIIALCLTFSDGVVQGQKEKPLDLKGKTLAERFEELLPGMGAKDIAARFGPQQAWQDICYKAGAPGNEKLRLAVCKLMLARLGDQTPTAARVWLLKQLEFLGRAESVDAVAALLMNQDALVHDAAVRCLANNPAPSATAKLIAAIPTANGKARIGLINALGFRADKSAVDALAAELTKGEKDGARAAANALGKIATPEAATVLGQALDETKNAKDDRRFWIADAFLLCADRRLREGKTKEAAGIYARLANGKDEARSIQLAAFQGILKTAGADAGPMILQAIAGKDADRRGIAIAQIDSLDPAALKHVAANIEKLPPPGQVILLGALANRKDKSQSPVALAALKHKEESVQRAGITALGKLGDATVVPILLEAIFANNKLSPFARDSLVAVTGDGVDDKIIVSFKQTKDPAQRKTLIVILESRRAVSAVPVLLEEARGDDAGLRGTAMTALRQLADPVHVPELLTALLKTAKGPERTEAELTLLAVCGKIVEAERRAEPVLAWLKKASQADKNALLPLLGRIGGNAAALAMIRHAVGSDNDDLRDAGFQAICLWPDPAVSEDLVKLVQSAKPAKERQQALRSLVRVNAAPSEKSAQFRLEMLKKAMTLAEDDNDRRMVLIDGLSYVKDIDTLRYVVPYLDNKALAQAACKTIVELAHSRTLREPNQAEFERVLDRVLAICKDKGLLERAKRYRQNMV